MPRLLFAAGQNSPTQTPVHFGIITAGSTIRAWHTDSGSIHINQARFTLNKPTCISITSTHTPPNSSAVKNIGVLAIGTDAGLIHLINLTTGELIETLRQSDDPTNGGSSRTLPVKDLVWSRDGAVLYSLAPKHVFVWQVSNKMASHSRLNIFGSLMDATSNSMGMDSSLLSLVDPRHEFLRRMTLNHNNDKLILGGTNSIFVYDLLSNSILAKYHGFIGKIVTLAVDTSPNNFTSQHHHSVVQSQFTNALSNNVQTCNNTEFFIVAGSNADGNATIYQFPPVNVQPNEQLILKKKNSKDPSATTIQFKICGVETATCSLPAQSLSLQLSVVYDNIGLTIPKDLNTMTPAELALYQPLTSNTRPNLILTAAMTNGSAAVFSIPKAQHTVLGSSSVAATTTATTTTAVTKKGKKATAPVASKASQNGPISVQIKPYRAITPKITIHDPTITNQHRTLSKEQSSNDIHAKVKTVNHSKLKKNELNLNVSLFQEGSINSAYLINLGQMCVVRNSTLRPKAQVIQLMQTSGSISLAKAIHLPPPQLSAKQGDLESFPMNESFINATEKLWKALIPIDKLRLTTNGDIELSRTQDKLLFDAVKSLSTKGKTTTNILISGSKQGSLSKMSVGSAMIDGDEDDVELLEKDKTTLTYKKQKLLQHAAKMNTSLRNILEENQDRLGLLALTPSFKQQNTFDENPFDAFPAIQGTLCGVLVQALKSGDDSSVEYVIKTGAQGLASQNGWGNLTRILNNPDVVRKLFSTSNEDDNNNNNNKGKNGQNNNNNDDKQNENNNTNNKNSSGIATIGNQWTHTSSHQIASGKTLIQTINLLPPNYIIPFIHILADKLALSPLRASELLPWIHVILRLHSMYLLSVPSVNEKLNQISNLLKQRTTTMDSAVQLKGRLEVIMTQFNNVNSNTQHSSNKKNNANGLDRGFVPLNVYSEDADRDQFHRLEDLEDNQDGFDNDPFSTKANKNKRKLGDNFSAFGLSLDSLGDVDDDDDDDDNEDDEMTGEFNDGEGEFDQSLFDMGFGQEGEEGEFFDEDGMFDDDDDDGEPNDVDDEMFDGSDDFELSGDDL